MRAALLTIAALSLALLTACGGGDQASRAPTGPVEVFAADSIAVPVHSSCDAAYTNTSAAAVTVTIRALGNRELVAASGTAGAMTYLSLRFGDASTIDPRGSAVRNAAKPGHPLEWLDDITSTATIEPGQRLTAYLTAAILGDTTGATLTTSGCSVTITP